jgi:hypothetical protein
LKLRKSMRLKTEKSFEELLTYGDISNGLANIRWNIKTSGKRSTVHHDLKQRNYGLMKNVHNYRHKLCK